MTTRAEGGEHAAREAIDPGSPTDSADVGADLNGNAAQHSTSPPVGQLAQDLDELRSLIERRGAEIDVMQGEKKSKWKDMATVAIAITALVVSVLSLVFTQINHSADQQAQDSQRLTTVLHDLAALQSQFYANGQRITNVVNFPSLNEAYNLIQSLEHTKYRSNPYAKISVAIYYNGTTEPSRAITLAKQAEDQAVHDADGQLTDKTESSRSLGTAYFYAGDPASGRAAYQRSNAYVDQAAVGYDHFLKTSQLFQTANAWTRAELIERNCLEAESQVRVQNAQVQSMAGMIRPQFQSLVNGAVENFKNTCGRPPAL